MLAGWVRKYTAAKRSECGTDMEVTDSELFLRAALVIDQAAQGLVDSRGREDWMTLLQALAQLSAAQAQDGDPAPLFAPEPLREKCAELDPREKPYWLTEEDSSRKKFSKAWDALKEVAPRLEANFLQRSQKARVAARLELFDIQKDLDKRAKLYGFRAVPIELPEDIGPQQREVAIAEERRNSWNAEIEYLEEMEVYPIPGVRRALRINLEGWRSIFMLTPLLLALVGGGFGNLVVDSILDVSATNADDLSVDRSDCDGWGNGYLVGLAVVPADRPENRDGPRNSPDDFAVLSRTGNSPRGREKGSSYASLRCNLPSMWW